MNYIREINAFYDHMERHPLSASAVTLWHALMHVNNKAMWAESFTVPGVVLKMKSGLTDSSFKRARKELVDAGYIDYKPSQSRKAPTYKMMSLCEDTILEPALVSTGENGDHTMDLLDDTNIHSSQSGELVVLDDPQARLHRREAIKQTESNYHFPITRYSQFHHYDNGTNRHMI